MPTNTLLEIKQAALRGYNPRQFATGTVGSFNTTMIVDTNRQEPQGEWERVDSWIKFTSGAAIGVERRVTGFSAGNSAIIFAPSVPSLSITTTYQIAKTFDDSAMLLNVNSSLRDMAPERIVQSFATAFSVGDSYNLSVPSQAFNPRTELVKIDRSWGTTNSDWEFRELYSGSDYQMDIAGGAAALRLAVTYASGNIFRFHYRRAATELVVDTDSTDEPMSLILAGTKKWMAIQDGDQEAIAKFGREFEAAKIDYARSRPVKNINTPRIGVY